MVHKQHLQLGVTAGAIYLLFLLLAPILPVSAAALTSVEVQIERIIESTTADHTINIVSPTGLAAGETITITYPSSSFTFGGSYNYLDIDLYTGSTNNCETATFTQQTIAATPSGSTYGATYASEVITITSGSGTIAADRCTRVVLNSNSVGHTIINPAVASNESFVIATTIGVDSGSAAVVILDDSTTPDSDQVQLTAQVLPAITMDIDVSITNCANSTETTPINNVVDLGVLFPGQINRSSGTVKFVCLDLSTNIPVGMKVLVRSSRNDVIGGLVGAGDYILSATADLNSIAVNEGYGLRVSGLGTTTIGTFVTSAPFDSGTPGSVGALPGGLAAAAAILTSNNIAETTSNNRIAIEIAAKPRVTNAVGVYTDTIVFTAMVNL